MGNKKWLGAFFFYGAPLLAAPSLTIFPADIWTERFCYYDGYVEECKSEYSYPQKAVAKTEILAADGSCVLTSAGVRCAEFVFPKRIPSEFTGALVDAVLLNDNDVCAIVGNRIWCSDKIHQARVDKFPVLQNPSKISNPPFAGICVADEGNAVYCVSDEGEVRKLGFNRPTNVTTVLSNICALENDRVLCLPTWGDGDSGITKAFEDVRAYSLVGSSDALCGVTGEKWAFCFRPHFSKGFDFNVSTAQAMGLPVQSFCWSDQYGVNCRSLFSEHSFSIPFPSVGMLRPLHAHSPSFCVFDKDGKVACKDRDTLASPFGKSIANFIKDENVFVHYSETELMALSRKELRIFGAQRRFSVNPEEYDGADQLVGNYFVKQNRIYTFEKTSPTFEAGQVKEIACGGLEAKRLVNWEVGTSSTPAVVAGGKAYKLPGCQADWELPANWAVGSPVGITETTSEKCIADSRRVFCIKAVDGSQTIVDLKEPVTAMRLSPAGRIFFARTRMVKEDFTDAFPSGEPLAPVLAFSKGKYYSVGARNRQLYHFRGALPVAGHAEVKPSEGKAHAFDGTLASQVESLADFPVLLFLLARTADPQEQGFLEALGLAVSPLEPTKQRACFTGPLLLNYLEGAPASTSDHIEQVQIAKDWLQAHAKELTSLEGCGKMISLRKVIAKQLLALVETNEMLLPAKALAQWSPLKKMLHEQEVSGLTPSQAESLRSFETTLSQHFYLHRRAPLWKALVTHLLTGREASSVR